MISLITFAILVLVLMQTQAPPEILDAKFYYSPMEAWSFFLSLSPTEQSQYTRELSLDIVFVFLYSSILYYSVKRLTRWREPYLRLVFLPGMFDLIENLSILSVLKTGQVPDPFLYLGIVTCRKWISSLVVVAAILFSWAHSSKLRFKN